MSLADGAELNMLGENPWTMPIEKLNPARAELFVHNIEGEYFRRLRAEDPVHLTSESEWGPYWSITRFNDIMEVETQPAIFSSEDSIVIGDPDPDREFRTPMFIAMDPPLHDIQRKAASPAVAPRQLKDLEKLIRQRVETILDSLPVDEEFDWVEKVSIELTTQMLATLFDFPFEDRHLLPYWSDIATSAPQVGKEFDPNEREKIMVECLQYFSRLWHERQAAPPRFDFISLLAHNPDTKDMIEDPFNFLGNLILLIVGGNDTTRNSISGGLYFLNKFPTQYDQLKADPGLVENMVSEIIRYQTPLAHMRRTARQDYELAGKQIRAGDKLVMWYISGNRDETVIPDADKFRIDRDRARHHIAFGFGIHRCMGNRVAEMQLRILWEEIMRRFTHIEVLEEPGRVVSNFVRGYEKMPVRIHGKTAS